MVIKAAVLTVVMITTVGGEEKQIGGIEVPFDSFTKCQEAGRSIKTYTAEALAPVVKFKGSCSYEPSI
jgi:hypothetical protein